MSKILKTSIKKFKKANKMSKSSLSNMINK